MSLKAVFDAERELGRFVQHLSNSPVADLWKADAARREVVGSFAIDGFGVDMEDLAVSLIDRNLLPVLQRDALDEPAQLMVVLQDLVAGRRRAVAVPAASPSGETKTGPGSVSELATLIAQVRASRRSVEAFIADLDSAEMDQRLPALPPPPLPAALSIAWLKGAWFGMTGTEIPVKLLEVATAAADLVVARPGLAGAIEALALVHDGAPPAMQPSYVSGAVRRGDADRRGWRFARLLAPFLIQHGCGLDSMAPWLSWGMRHDSRTYARLVSGDSAGWVTWTLAGLADQFRYERGRVSRIQSLIDGWEHRFTGGGKRRWQRNVKVLGTLFEHGAFTTKSLQRLRAGDLRSAQMLIKELKDRGIVQCVHHGKGREWFTGIDVFEK
jgi:hypothetical protein